MIKVMVLLRRPPSWSRERFQYRSIFAAQGAVAKTAYAD